LFDANNSKQIQFDIQIKQENTLSLSKSISFGLLLSELISNSCKYAIINNQVKIGICIKKQDDALIMNYTDSGNGLPENMKNFKNGGFGFRLIDNFIKQLKGKGTFPENNHFNFELEFTT
jgi:two-component sensor histidine kinase